MLLRYPHESKSFSPVLFNCAPCQSQHLLAKRHGCQDREHEDLFYSTKAGVIGSAHLDSCFPSTLHS